MTEGHSTLLKSEDGEREREKRKTQSFSSSFSVVIHLGKKRKDFRNVIKRKREEKKHSLRSTHDYSLSMTTR